MPIFAACDQVPWHRPSSALRPTSCMLQLGAANPIPRPLAACRFLGSLALQTNRSELRGRALSRLQRSGRTEIPESGWMALPVTLMWREHLRCGIDAEVVPVKCWPPKSSSFARVHVVEKNKRGEAKTSIMLRCRAQLPAWTRD